MSARAFQAALRCGSARVDADLTLEEGRLGGRLTDAAGPRRVEGAVRREADGTLVLVREGRRVVAHAVHARGRWWLSIEGRAFEVEREQPGQRRHAAGGEEPFAVSPMTGLVAKVAVAPGEAVAAGATLFVVEAMKMEYAVKAVRAVTVAEVRRRSGEKVALGEVVVTFEEPR